MTSSKTSVTEIKGSALYGLFQKKLKNLYWAETKLVSNLPEIGNAATAEDLRYCLQNHHQETIRRLGRLEKVFDLLNEFPSGESSFAIEGLLKETNQLLRESPSDTAVRDAGIIMMVQQLEHHQIATYGSLSAFAKRLGLEECFDILQAGLNADKLLDATLTQIAEGHVNTSAQTEEKEKGQKLGGREVYPRDGE